MKKRTCQECNRALSRAACVRKDDGTLIHGGSCGSVVTEETLPDIISKYRKEKNLRNGKS